MTETPYLTPGVEEAAPSLMQRAATILPMARYAPKNPALLLGAVAVGIVGVLAWRNREKIAATARPLLQNAAARTHALADRAMVKGEEIVESARATAATMASKARGSRKPDPTMDPLH